MLLVGGWSQGFEGLNSSPLPSSEDFPSGDEALDRSGARLPFGGTLAVGVAIEVGDAGRAEAGEVVAEFVEFSLGVGVVVVGWARHDGSMISYSPFLRHRL